MSDKQELQCNALVLLHVLFVFIVLDNVFLLFFINDKLCLNFCSSFLSCLSMSLAQGTWKIWIIILWKNWFLISAVYPACIGSF